MGKNKNREARSQGAAPVLSADADRAPGEPASSAQEPPAPEGAAAQPAQPAAPERPAAEPPPRSRLRNMLPDLVKATLALAVVIAGAAIWYEPPLIRSDRPAVTYQFEGKTFSDADLYRPLAMPTRYYIGLPRTLAGRYTWFAVDRRREVAALTEAPQGRLLGRPSIKRGAPLGLDLEFRKLDNSEWRVFFLPDQIVFSNAVLSVRLSASKPAAPASP